LKSVPGDQSGTL